MCGEQYEQEVEVEGDHCRAIAAAFAIRLPLSIGEIMGVKTANEKKKKGWDAMGYVWTEHILSTIGARELYLQRKRTFVLNTEHPGVTRIEKELP
jgi:hypothetical protein